MSRRRLTPFVALLACAVALATPPSGPDTPGPTLQPSWPVGAIGPDPRPVDCDVQLLMASLPQPDGSYQLIARARSWASRDLVLTVPTTCPNGPAAFFGLPEGYDYYGTCNAGACLPTPLGRKTVVLPAGGMIDLASTTINPLRSTCNAALPPGDHPISYTLDLRGARVCGPDANGVNIPHPPSPSAAPSPTPASPACPPMPTCGIGCNGPPLRDANGCALCGCEEPWGIELFPTQP
jgi:hypothetical protein